MTYGKTVLSSRASAYQRNHNVVTMNTNRSALGPVSNIIVLVVLMCLLGLMYLTQVTKTNALGYKVSDLTSKQTDLKEEYASLQVESERLQSLERVKASEAAAKLPDTRPTAFVSN